MAFSIQEVESYQVLKLKRAAAYQERLSAEGPASPLMRWAAVSMILAPSPSSTSAAPILDVITIRHPELPLFSGKSRGIVRGPSCACHAE